VDSLSILFLILAIISWGAGAFFDKMTLKYINSTTAFFGRTLVMLVLFMPLLFSRISATHKELSVANKNAWIYLASSVIVTMSGVYFYLRSMSSNEASKIVPLSSTYPLVTMLLAFLFLNESITLNKMIGTILISFGIYFITK